MRNKFVIIMRILKHHYLYLCLLLCFFPIPIKAQFLQGDTIVVNDTIVALDNITVTAQKNVIQKVDKIVYRINEKDFLRHAKADNALRRLPERPTMPSGDCPMSRSAPPVS